MTPSWDDDDDDASFTFSKCVPSDVIAIGANTAAFASTPKVTPPNESTESDLATCESESERRRWSADVDPDPRRSTAPQSSRQT